MKDTHVIDAPPAAATGAATVTIAAIGKTARCTAIAAVFPAVTARQRGQVRQASEGGVVVVAGAVWDARGFVAEDVTEGGHLSRIERQPVCEGELVVAEGPAGVERRRRE